MGAPFNLSLQQNPREFFDGLVRISDSVANSFAHTLEKTHTCLQCKHSSVVPVNNFVFELHISQQLKHKQSVTLDELMHDEYAASKIEGSLCSACRNGSYDQRIKITNPSDLLLVQLLLWDEHHNKINNFKLLQPPRSIFKAFTTR